jgi:hypothetical protein
MGVKSGRRVGLIILPPSVSRMSENLGASPSRNPKCLHGMYRDKVTFYLQESVPSCISGTKQEKPLQEDSNQGKLGIPK